ncbi:MAG: histidine kinase [Gammaproteobacteria bacterium]|nr:histidine kinase [Gammaproteobacteria bacterium]
MSRPGAVERAPAAQLTLAERLQADPNDFFLPDFCQPKMVLAVVLISELLAVVFTLARPATESAFMAELGRISLFVQWLGLTGAGVLCCMRRPLAGLPVPAAALAVFGLMMVNTAVFSEAASWLGRSQAALAGDSGPFPTDRWGFLLRNEGICLIVTALLQRYFYISHQWRRQVRAEARARIHALQARMRPHFLFNTMNTIAALTRTDPARAEEAVEDLADLLRATLREAERPLRVEDEIELTRIYQRIEELRIGPRLKVSWNVEDLPRGARMPGLTLQPLLENAIYHGVEPLAEGGTVEIEGRIDGEDLVFRLTNPVASSRLAEERPGNREAVVNIRERLRLAYGERGRLDVQRDGSTYSVELRFPVEA